MGLINYILCLNVEGVAEEYIFNVYMSCVMKAPLPLPGTHS